MITEQAKNLLGYERTYSTSTESIKQKGFQEAIVLVLNSSSHIVCARKDAGWIPFYQDPQVGDIFAELIVQNQFSDGETLVSEINRFSIKTNNEAIREGIERAKITLSEINKSFANNEGNLDTLISLQENLKLMLSGNRISFSEEQLSGLLKIADEMANAIELYKVIRTGILSVDDSLKKRLLAHPESKDHLHRGLTEFQNMSLKEFRQYRVGKEINFEELVLNLSKGMNLEKSFSLFSIKVI